MTERFEFDHLSIAVRRPLDVARTLRRELGCEPLTGGVLPQFRYLLMHVGDVVGEGVVGGRLELIATPERQNHGFMHRFLERHGEAAHHLSFNVPKLFSVRESLHAAGFDTVQEDLEFPNWQELFVPPDVLHGVLIQVASTPKPIRTRDLFGTTERDWAALPNNRHGANPGWWDQLWEVPVPRSTGCPGPGPDSTKAAEVSTTGPSGIGDRATLGPVVLGTNDLDRSDVLFREILHGAPAPTSTAVATSPAATDTDGAARGRTLPPTSYVLPDRARTYTWPTGSLVVVENDPGVRGVVCEPPTNRPTGAGSRTDERHRRVGAVRFSPELKDLL